MTTTTTTASVARDVDAHIVTLLTKLSALRECNQQSKRRRDHHDINNHHHHHHNHHDNNNHHDQMERRHNTMSYEVRSMELWRAVAVECYGTFLFAFIVNSPAAFNTQNSLSGVALVILAIALASGFAIAAIQTIFGPVSGKGLFFCHQFFYDKN